MEEEREEGRKGEREEDRDEKYGKQAEGWSQN